MGPIPFHTTQDIRLAVVPFLPDSFGIWTKRTRTVAQRMLKCGWTRTRRNIYSMVTTRRTAAVQRPIEDTEALIDHLMPMLSHQLSNDVSNIYFGDVGVYLPSHFLGPRKEQRAVLALSPAYDRLEQRVASQETRLIGVDIIGLVNITPYCDASPKEAYGERQLASLMRKIR